MIDERRRLTRRQRVDRVSTLPVSLRAALENSHEPRGMRWPSDVSIGLSRRRGRRCRLRVAYRAVDWRRLSR